MLQPATADIIPLIRNLVRALQPYGEAKDIKLAFHSAIEQQIIYRSIEFAFAIGYEIENGKISHHWLIADQMALMEQLGVLNAVS